MEQFVSSGGLILYNSGCKSTLVSNIGPDKDRLCTINCIYFFIHQFKHVFGCSEEPSH